MSLTELCIPPDSSVALAKTTTLVFTQFFKITAFNSLADFSKPVVI